MTDCAPTLRATTDRLSRIAGFCGLLGGLLFFAGDMAMYGRLGAGADFAGGSLATVRTASLTRLFAGGLIGPLAAGLCMAGFWQVYRNMAAGLSRTLFLPIALGSMLMLGAVHVLWVAKGLLKRECVGTESACGKLPALMNSYWNTAYYFGVAPAYLACALLLIMTLRGRTLYPRWTVIFNPAFALLVSPLLIYLPSPIGEPLVGGDANLFIAIFFLVSVSTTWSAPSHRSQKPRVSFA